jgi:hypothetical protein
MARLIAVVAFAVSVLSAQAVFAKPHEDNKHHGVPELSGAGAAAGLVLVGGAVAIALGRRRARKS